MPSIITAEPGAVHRYKCETYYEYVQSYTQIHCYTNKQ